MRRVLVALAVPLVLPSCAQAADYLVVYVNPTTVASGGALGGSIVGGNVYGGDDVFGLTLTRAAAGRPLLEEKHALRSHHAKSTIAFDGRAGRVSTTAGDMTGSFTATFAGWGRRSLRLQPGGYAAFRRSGS